MKLLKDGFVLRQVADTWVVMPLGQVSLDFNGMLTLNETGALLWQALEKLSGREIEAFDLDKYQGEYTALLRCRYKEGFQTVLP